MIVILHIFIAMSSVAYATYLLVRPSKRLFTAHYALITATLTSGTYIVLSTGAPMLSSCISGLAYTAFVSLCTLLAFVRMRSRTSV